MFPGPLCSVFHTHPLRGDAGSSRVLHVLCGGSRRHWNEECLYYQHGEGKVSFSVQAKTCFVVVKEEPFALRVGSLSLLQSPEREVRDDTNKL